MPEVQTYRTHAHVRCQSPHCGCESIVEARAKVLTSSRHVLERPTQVCPVCRHASWQHECLGEIPFEGRHAH